jgi:hypothetical protein
MTNPTITAEEIKARVDMPALVSYILVEYEDREGTIPEDRLIRCLRHEDRSPSMMVNEETVYCFACEKTWDVIQLIRDYHNLSFNDTLLWFEEHIDELEDEVEVAEAAAAPPKVTTSALWMRMLLIIGILYLLRDIGIGWKIIVYFLLLLLTSTRLVIDRTSKPTQFPSGAGNRGIR